MGFWIFMFVMDLLTPVMMIIIGKVFTHNPPKHINNLYGYRTPMSMKNDATWEFAQKHWGYVCFKSGLLTLLSPLALLPFIHGDTDTIGIAGTVICSSQIAVLLITIYFTEKALKKNFNKFGERI